MEEEKIPSKKSSFQGAKAEERTIQSQESQSSYIQQVGNYISSYLPPSIKSQFPVQRASNVSTSEEKDIILSVSFDFIERRQVLILTYVNGFQVWDITNLQNVRELISKKEGPIKIVKFLPTPLKEEKEGNPLFGKRPLFGVISSADSSSTFPNTMLQFYSLVTNEYVNKLKFKTEIYGFNCNRRTLVISLKDHLYGFDAVTMQKLFLHQIYPLSESLSFAIALGSRWLAFPGIKPATSVGDTPSNTEKFMGLAKGFASGVFSFSQKAMNDYFSFSEKSSTSLSSEPPTNQPPETSAAVGTVVVYDFCNNNTISHFTAHSHPISALAFDGSGSLLVTASIEGHSFNVFQITPSLNGGSQPTFRHLYKLQRGLTNATIQHISFSEDSRWISFNSTRGTTHIFAINPRGGPVNIHTHLSSALAHRYRELPLYHNENTSLQTLSPIQRIKQNFEPENVPPGIKWAVGPASTFVGSHQGTLRFCVISGEGLLTQFSLKPCRPAPDSDLSPEMLQLTIEPSAQWYVQRGKSWSEIPFVMPSPSKNPLSGSKDNLMNPSNNNEPHWLSNIEIFTHNHNFPKVWATSQFTFKTYEIDIKNIQTFNSSLPKDLKSQSIKIQQASPMPMGNLSFLNTSQIVEQELSSSQLNNNFGFSQTNDKEIEEKVQDAMKTALELNDH